MGSHARATRRCAATLATALAAVGAPAATAAAQGPDPLFLDGQSQPVYTGEPVIREDVWIETTADSDGDGALDRVHAEVARTQSTALGRRMPVIVQPSPYYAGGNDITNHNVDLELYEPGKPGRDNRGPDGEPSARNGAQQGAAGPAIGPGRYESYFVPRGFAFVYAESLGTGGSTGCPTIGGRSETLGMVAVVDWLNGRARAWDAAGQPVEATWSTGQVGMMGVSYNGTLPNAAASTGVAGLEAIVPIAAISSWYDYYRANGAVIAPGGFQGEDEDVLFDYVLTRQGREICAPVRDMIARRQDRVTGDYSPFWAERDYTLDAGRVRAAVLAVHGLNDENVKTQHVAQWYEPLAERGVPRKIWLHQRGHSDPFTDTARQAPWLRTLNRWMTRWLYDHENGVEHEPRAVVQRESLALTEEADWPAPGTEPVRLWLTPGTDGAAGGLASFSQRYRGLPVFEPIVDDARVPLSTLVNAASHPARLVYRTPALSEAVRMSGTTKLDLRLAFDRGAANVSAALVDFRPNGTAFVVNRGWTDPQNRKSRSATFAIQPGTPYEIAFGLQPDDYVFAAGSRLGIVLYSSDRQHSLRPAPGTTLTLDTTRSAVDLPVVGGATAFAAATAG